MAKKKAPAAAAAGAASTPAVQGEEVINEVVNDDGDDLDFDAGDDGDTSSDETDGDAEPVVHPEGYVVIDGVVHQRPAVEPHQGPPMVTIRPEADFSISLRGVLISFSEGKKVSIELDVLAAVEETGAPFTKVG